MLHFIPESALSRPDAPMPIGERQDMGAGRIHTGLQMPNTIIDNLIEERADIFLSAFNQRSKALFRDDTKANKVRHPGEFGTYRESITADFLRCFLPQHLSIDTGFIVSSLGDVSKQVDLVIYDPSMTPPLESKQRQRFFPIETVVAAGEVRSEITKQSLDDALERLAEVKDLRAKVNSQSSAVKRWYGLGDTKYDPSRIPFDQVFTFLVCKRFGFRFECSFPSTLDELYRSVEYGLRHSAILSVEDGLLYYSGILPDGTMGDTYFPTSLIDGTRHLNKWIRRHENRYAPLKVFCASMFMHACHCTVGYADLAQYQSVGKYHFWTERADRLGNKGEQTSVEAHLRR